jgi:protein-tyrosine phosphatase
MSFFNQIALITNNLYLSSASALTAKKLTDLGITNVINATLEVPDVYVKGIDVVRISLEDSPHSKLSAYFDQASDSINEVARRGGKTLVHCVAGVSRSASLCIAYMMKYHNMTLRKAYFHVKQARPVVRPNVGFFRQLIAYEKKLYGVASVNMVNSPIGMVPCLYMDDCSQLVW